MRLKVIQLFFLHFISSISCHRNASAELQDAAKAAKSWDDLDHKTTEKLKTWWMCHKMQSILNKCEEKNSIAFTQALIQHAKDTTVRNRTFMEENPSLPEPSNHKEYPGKMDHTSCIAYVNIPCIETL